MRMTSMVVLSWVSLMFSSNNRSFGWTNLSEDLKLVALSGLVTGIAHSSMGHLNLFLRGLNPKIVCRLGAFTIWLLLVCSYSTDIPLSSN